MFSNVMMYVTCRDRYIFITYIITQVEMPRLTLSRPGFYQVEISVPARKLGSRKSKQGRDRVQTGSKVEIECKQSQNTVETESKQACRRARSGRNSAETALRQARESRETGSKQGANRVETGRDRVKTGLKQSRNR